MTDWYSISNIAQIDSPALIIYPDNVQKNINLLISMIDDVNRLRPHIKTHKNKESAIMQLNAGIQKFKCATIAEAELLGAVNAPDVLLAYQPVGPKVDRFIQLSKQYPSTQFSCLVDDIKSAEIIANKALQAGIVIPIYLDINIGMNRTGIVPDNNAILLYEYCSKLEGIQVLGLHAYDGHIHEENFEERKKNCDEAFNKIDLLSKGIVALGLSEPKIIIGGSPTFPIHAKRKNIECSPGTFIYWDAGYQQILSEQNFSIAALIISRVISNPAPHLYCLDLGHKSIASEKDITYRIRFLNAPDLEFIGQSEEHLVIRAPENQTYKIGDVLYGVPWHICPTVALYEKAWIVENHAVIDSWQIIARNRKINI